MVKTINGERAWLVWLVRVVIPALIIGMWWNLATVQGEVKTEVRELRIAVQDNQITGLRERGELWNQITRIEACLGVDP